MIVMQPATMTMYKILNVESPLSKMFSQFILILSNIILIFPSWFNKSLEANNIWFLALKFTNINVINRAQLKSEHVKYPL